MRAHILWLALGLFTACTERPIPNEKTREAIEVVFVKGGTFTMGCTEEEQDCRGDAKPAHQVQLSDFYMGKYEVTQEQWEAVMGENSSYQEDCKTCPAKEVTWQGVQEYIRRLNVQTGKFYRLPTEAEWEYAARGGILSKGYRYAGSNEIDSVAWHGGDWSYELPHPVGEKKANELGLYDMTGNVSEWCWDWYQKDYYAASPLVDPYGPDRGGFRVVRGGDFSGISKYMYVTARSYNSPDGGLKDIGFRLVLDVHP